MWHAMARRATSTMLRLSNQVHMHFTNCRTNSDNSHKQLGDIFSSRIGYDASADGFHQNRLSLLLERNRKHGTTA